MRIAPLLLAVICCQVQEVKADTPVSLSTVRLIVETDNGTVLDNKDAALSGVRQKIQLTLERANLKVVAGPASRYDAVVRVHYRGCSISGCSSVLTVTRNGKQLGEEEMGFFGLYSYDYPFAGEFTLALLTNDPSPLLHLLADPDITARSSAPIMLAGFPQPSVVSALTNALTDENIRDNAMNALAKIAKKSTDPMLWKPLFVAGADDEWIRRVFSERPPQFTSSLLSVLSASKNPATYSAANELTLKINTVGK